MFVGKYLEIKKRWRGVIEGFWEIVEDGGEFNERREDGNTQQQINQIYQGFNYNLVRLQNSQMGLCVSESIKRKKEKQETMVNDNSIKRTQMITKVNTKSSEYLKIIYKDLASRSKNKKLNLHNFSLFFELTGLWGYKLFKYFSTNGCDEIASSQFINGIIEIVSATFEQKVKLLFNFIKNSKDDGIQYKQFLKMLYHYSKNQLKQIMTNDGVFIHQAIIPSTIKLQNQKKNIHQNVGNGIVHLQHSPLINRSQSLSSGKSSSSLNANNDNQNHFKKAYQKIFKDYQDPGTLLQFKTQKITYQVFYCNMSSLTKQYASHIFNKYDINQEKSTMKQQQFRNYLQGNMKLFDTYYATFHEKLWGFKNGQPTYAKYIEKQTDVILMEDQNSLQCHMMLVSSTLVMCAHVDKKSEVIRMINLSGVAVSESDENRMVIKDEPDANFTSTIQFESKQQAIKWLTELKQYSNNYFQSKYEVLEPIGTGKFSIVYKCRERSTSQQYALKIIQLEKLTQKQLQIIENETQITKILKSPNFIKYYQTIFTKKTIYIVSEYIYGQDLFEYVKKKKRLKQSQSAFFLGQIIQSTLLLHNFEIIHRDLKPENIMIVYKKNNNINSQEQLSPHKTSKPIPQKTKIIDFGFANYFSVLQQRKDQTPVGTLNYMAPQILLGQKPTYQNDTFAIGSILYFMLKGKYPFQSTNPVGTAVLTVKGDYSLSGAIWQEISDEAKDLVQMLLKTDPEERITLKQAINHPWFKSVSNYNPESF